MNPSAQPIHGLVAAFLDTNSIVINKGSAAGVKIGQQYSVKSMETIVITDPETKKVLGETRRSLCTIEVTAVQELLAICRSIREPAFDPCKGKEHWRSLANLLSETTTAHIPAIGSPVIQIG